MDMFDGVGRRRDEEKGEFLNIGQHSLNGFERDSLFRNNGDGTFTDVGFVNAADRIEDGRGLSIFDYDRDGQLDLLLRNYRQPAELLRNRGGRRHWLAVKLVSRYSNRDAVGARVRLRTARGWQTRVVSAGSAYLSGQSLRQHFGLGDEPRAAEVVIEWPSGGRTAFENLAADRQYVITEWSAPAGAPKERAGRLSPPGSHLRLADTPPMGSGYHRRSCRGVTPPRWSSACRSP